MKSFLILFISLLFLEAKTIVVASSSEFPLNKLTKEQVKGIYLGKIRRIKRYKIIPVNLKAKDPLRKEFEKYVLKKSGEWLNRHWLQAHYHGHHPPKVFHSKKAAILFVKKVKKAVCYLYEEDAEKADLKILYKEEVK